MDDGSWLVGDEAILFGLPCPGTRLQSQAHNRNTTPARRRKNRELLCTIIFDHSTSLFLVGYSDWPNLVFGGWAAVFYSTYSVLDLQYWRVWTNARTGPVHTLSLASRAESCVRPKDRLDCCWTASPLSKLGSLLLLPPVAIVNPKTIFRPLSLSLLLRNKGKKLDSRD